MLNNSLDPEVPFERTSKLGSFIALDLFCSIFSSLFEEFSLLSDAKEYPSVAYTLLLKALLFLLPCNIFSNS